MRPITASKKYNSFVLLLIAVISAFFAFQIQYLSFDYDFEAFFPNEDHELELYNTYRETFEYDNEFVLLGLENKKGIFQKDFLLRIDSLTKHIQHLPYVKKVNSPTNLKKTDLSGPVPFQTRLLHFENEVQYGADSAGIYHSAFLVGSYFPSDAGSLCIFIKTNDLLTKKQSDLLVLSLTNTINKYRFDAVHIAGRIFAQKVYLENIRKEFLMFLLISFFLVILFLWFSFRNLHGVVIPVVVVLLSILWTLGILQLLGKSIDIMSIMLPTMIFVTGISDVVHFFSKYFEEMEKGTAKNKIYPIVLREVAFPTFMTLITTVVGFLSLLFSSIKPIREFGLYTSIGITLAFIFTYTLLPAILYFFSPPPHTTNKKSATAVNSFMRSGFFWILRHQRTTLIAAALLLVLSVVGIYRIKVNNILLEDLSNKVKIKQDFMFFDKHYSGARPLELLVTLKDTSAKVWEHQTMQQLFRLDSFIRKEYDAGFVVSLSSLAMEMQRINNYAYTGSFPNEEEYRSTEKYLEKNRNSRDLKKLMASHGHSTRISAKIKDMGSIKVNEHNQHFMSFVKNATDTSMLDVKITGAAHLIDRNNEYMVSNMSAGFLFSIGVICLLTFFLHRSWRMILVFLLPNLFPLLVVAGIMGYAGIELKAATSLIFSIAFGIATDDTIHFISRLRLELGYGKSLLYAFKRTYFETGKPILVSTFILVGGFASLMTSNFESTFYFGFLICITVIVAVLADIFLLPALLFLVYRKKGLQHTKPH